MVGAVVEDGVQGRCIMLLQVSPATEHIIWERSPLLKGNQNAALIGLKHLLGDCQHNIRPPHTVCWVMLRIFRFFRSESTNGVKVRRKRRTPAKLGQRANYPCDHISLPGKRSISIPFFWSLDLLLIYPSKPNCLQPQLGRGSTNHRGTQGR